MEAVKTRVWPWRQSVWGADFEGVAEAGKPDD
jgi:hypothetical protein